jgi:hypothetical protein
MQTGSSIRLSRIAIAIVLLLLALSATPRLIAALLTSRSDLDECFTPGILQLHFSHHLSHAGMLRFIERLGLNMVVGSLYPVQGELTGHGVTEETSRSNVQVAVTALTDSGIVTRCGEGQSIQSSPGQTESLEKRTCLIGNDVPLKAFEQFRSSGVDFQINPASLTAYMIRVRVGYEREWAAELRSHPEVTAVSGWNHCVYFPT